MLNEIIAKYEKGEDVSEVFSPPGIDELTPAAITGGRAPVPEQEPLRRGDAVAGEETHHEISRTKRMLRSPRQRNAAGDNTTVCGLVGVVFR